MISNRNNILAASVFFAAFIASPAAAQYDPAAHPIFDEDAVHTIRVTFHQPDWWNQLRANFEGLDDPLYLEAEFDWENIHYDQIGVRFKGNSSYNSYPGQKKSFKLKFDEYIDAQSIYGLDKINLNNAFKDPSFVREKCFYELADEMGLPACRTNFAALYINGTYWGLYSLVEQIDKEFIESRFGSSEDGNLWKCEPRGTFEYLGPNEASYYSDYELKTNETVNDWSTLVEMIDALNNTPSQDLAAAMHLQTDISSAMAMLAISALTVNLDSYVAMNHNHYVYHRDGDDRFVHINWDANEAWGCFSSGMPISQLKTLPVNYLRHPATSRPLANELWAIPEFYALYTSHIRRVMKGGADPDVLLARMEELRDLIRPYVYADWQMMYTPGDFDNAMTHDIGSGPGGASPGLDPFVRGRHASLLNQIGAFSGRDEIVLNELMAKNGSTISDGNGDFDDWVEILNTGASAISLSGLYLTDDPGVPTAYAFPNVVLQPGERYLVWTDGEPAQGVDHAGFGMDADGESLFLFDGAELLDTTTWPDLDEDEAYGRFPDGSGAWTSDLVPTPGTPNVPPIGDGSLFINEFLASNDTGITDEMGEYEDWVELYNPGTTGVDLGGYFLTDDLSEPQQWQFPAVTIPAGGYLIVWCDGEESDGPLHTGSKLSAGGEEIGLYGPASAGTPLIDSYLFGAQATDVSEGRESDGAATWTFFSTPTPGSANAAEGPRPLVYGIGKLTTLTTVPLLVATGEPSATSGTFDLQVDKARPTAFGLVFSGPDRDRKPFYGAERWVHNPLTRLGTKLTGATGSVVYSVPIDGGMVGERTCYQYWFRDVGHPDGTNCGLSNAVEVIFWP